MNILPQILLQIILIMCNAFFACAEIAVISIPDAKLEKLSAEGNKRAVRLRKLTAQPAKFLATIQVAITLSGFLGSAFAADNFSEIIVNALIGAGVKIPVSTLQTVSVVLITLILSFVTLVFGELVPKRIAMKKSETLGLAMSTVISFISKIFAPVVALLTASTNGILRLIGIDPNAKDDEVTEEEIRMMVDAGSESGSIDTEEKELIQNVFEFDDLSAGEIATHRRSITLLWNHESVTEWERTVRKSRHTYFPICDGSIDNVTGVLNAKDFFRLQNMTKESILKNAVRAPYFVPESARANVLFENMKKTRNYFAVVVDEYGGLSGIVTITDLLECIVGDIFDDDEPGVQIPDIEPLDSKTWRISGKASLDDVEKALGLKLECDYDTFAGYVLTVLGSLPEDGTMTSLATDRLAIKVTSVRDHCIESTMVSLLDEPTEEE